MAKRETTPLGNALKLARVAKGWTMEQASEMSKLNPVTIGSYERGYRVPPIDTLIKLSYYYGVTVASLIGERCPSCNTEAYIAELQATIKALREAK